MVIGPFINASAVLVGGVIGALLSQRLPERIRLSMTSIFGLASLGIGILLVVKCANLPVMVLATLVGALIGEFCYLEKGINTAVAKAQTLFMRSGKKQPHESFIQNYVAIIVLFCASGTGIFGAINAVTSAGVATRQQAATVMREYLKEEGVIQFLLKSFVDGAWRFNVPVLWEQYPHIVGWEAIPAWDHPALFIPGGNSPYVTEAYRSALLAQFPQAKAHVIAGAGHWVHAEKPDAVLRAIRRYLSE